MRSIFRIILLGIAFTLGTGFILAALCALSPAAALASGGQARPAEERQLTEAYESGSLIRLHILAEDDSKEAQTIKLAVRDALLQAFSKDLLADNPEVLFQSLQARVDDMRAVAEQTALSMGFDGAVTAEVGIFTLPEKRYGSVLLPYGQYRALRITLGTGAGQNWWCVLYPSLCLAVADDEPWRTPAPEGDELPKAQDASPTVTWDSERILSHWLLWEGNAGLD